MTNGKVRIYDIISFWLKIYGNCCFWYILFFLGTLA